MEFKGLIYNGVDYSDSLEVSKCGKIRRIGKSILKTRIHKSGYEVVNISLGSRDNKKTFRVHSAVLCTYIDNIDNKPEVNHKDGNKLNNNVSNLEWSTPSENVKHAFDIGLTTMNRETNNWCKRAKRVRNIENNIVFNTLREAANFIIKDRPISNRGVATHIREVCNGVRARTYGLTWEWC